MEENLSKFWFGDWPSLPREPEERKQKKEEQQRFAKARRPRRGGLSEDN